MKRIERLRQWTGERIGALVGPGSESDLADDDIQSRKAGLERLQAATALYTEQLSKRKKFSSIDANNKLFPIDAVGKAATMYSLEYDTDGVGAFPRALSLFGQTHQAIAEEVDCFATDLVANFSSQLDQSLSTIAQYNAKQKKLESKRSAVESLTAKMQKSKSESPKLEDELRQAQDTYDEATEEVKQLAITIREDEPIQFESLTYFLNAELAFVHKYLTHLQDLKSQWPSSYSSSIGPKISQNPTNDNSTSPKNKAAGRFRSSSLGSRRPNVNSSPNSRKQSRATSPISEAPSPPPEQDLLDPNSLTTSAAMMSLKEVTTRKRSNTQGSARSNTSTPVSDKASSVGGTVASTTAKVRSRASSIPLPRPSISRIGSFIKMGGSSSSQGRSAYDQLLPSGQNGGNTAPDTVHERASEDSYDQGGTERGQFMMGGSMAHEDSSDEDTSDFYRRTPLLFSNEASSSQSIPLKSAAPAATATNISTPTSRRPPPPVPTTRKRSETVATFQPQPQHLASPFDDPT